MMMQPTHLWDFPDWAKLWPLDRPRQRTIHVQGSVRTPAMIILEVTGQQPPEMALVQDDHVVQAFTADTPDQPLDVRILPRTPWGDHDLLDPHMLDPLPKGSAIDAVPIAQEIPRGLVPREGLNDLLGGPLRGRMLGDVEVDDAPSRMGQDDQDKEHRVPHGGDHKEIQGHQVLHVIREKGLPCWRRRRLRSDTILLHRRFGPLDTP